PVYRYDFPPTNRVEPPVTIHDLPFTDRTVTLPFIKPLKINDVADIFPAVSNRRLVLGVTGGIAAYKAAELTRELVRGGYDAKVVMTESARGFVTPETFQALSGNRVFTSMWDPRIRDNRAHIGLSRGKAAIVVAPATADFIAKLAHGLADDLLSTLCV